MRKRTHCKHGHSLLDPSNVRTYIDEGWTRRRCLTCERHQPYSKMPPNELRRVTAATSSPDTSSGPTTAHGMRLQSSAWLTIRPAPSLLTRWRRCCQTEP
jgi:hypothetical protein